MATVIIYYSVNKHYKSNTFIVLYTTILVVVKNVMIEIKYLSIRQSHLWCREQSTDAGYAHLRAWCCRYNAIKVVCVLYRISTKAADI